MLLPFVKYTGCGNDFILFDNRQQVIEIIDRKRLSEICHRQAGIGADGVLFLEKSAIADFRMRIFNSDGSEAEMCGNGMRCLAKFIYELDKSKSSFTIETKHLKIPVALIGEVVQIAMPMPFVSDYHLLLGVEGKTFIAHYLDTGVPHAVVFVEDIEDGDFIKFASQIRFHPRFHPKGANVNFVQLAIERGKTFCNSLYVRTYERGVEHETLACGTGALASALAAAKLHSLSSPITVHARSRESLQIAFENSGNGFDKISMTGPAVKVYSGEIDF